MWDKKIANIRSNVQGMRLVNVAHIIGKVEHGTDFISVRFSAF